MKTSTINQDDHLVFGGCDTVTLAQKYGTPLYVVDEGNIIERCKEIRDCFTNKYANTSAVYACKAFQTLEMCRIVTREGMGLDVVSAGEIYTALKAGVDPESIIFHGNNKTREEITLGIEANVGRFVVDNEYELECIEAIASALGKTVNIQFRITPGVDSHTHKFISTGNIDSKFGISLEQDQRDRIIRRALEMEHVELMGFHFHVGSQLLENTSHLAALEIILNLVDEVYRKLGFVTKELNLGGGFGIHYGEGDFTTKVSEFTDPMMAMIEAFFEQHQMPRPAVIIEPGRWIVGEAGITLYTVGAIKAIPGIKTYAAVDGGMPDNPRPMLYQAQYEAVLANKASAAATRIVTVAGKCCESGDVLIENLNVGEIESGDILAVFSTGAYNYSMASNYNRIPRPAVVMVKKGQDHLSVMRESYHDLIAREK